MKGAYGRKDFQGIEYREQEAMHVNTFPRDWTPVAKIKKQVIIFEYLITYLP